MRRRRYTHLAALLLFIGYGLHAQTNRVTFDIISGANGITLGKVNSVTQDKYGFMWFSDQTNQCIVRYDGTTMKRYAYDFANQDTPNGMGGHYPEWLTTDRDGYIWIAYYGQGLDRFDPRSGTFVHYKNNPDDSTSLISNIVACAIVDHVGYVWIGTHSGLDRLDPKTGHFTHYVNEPDNPNSLSYNVVRSVYEDRDGTIWVGTGFPFEPGTRGGLNRFDRKSENFTRYLNDPTDPTTLAGNKVRALYEDSRGNFWVGSDGPEGLQIMNRENGTFTRYPYDPNDTTKLSRPPMGHAVDHITFITEDNEDQIWIGTLIAGVNRYDPVSKKIVHYGGERNVSGDFIDTTTWCAYVSRDGLVWISTQEPHLYKVDPVNLYIDYKQDDLLSFALENETTAWYGFDDRVIREDLKKGTKQVFWHSPENLRGHVRKILRDHSGTMWLATTWGLGRYDSLTTDFTVYRMSDKKTDSRNWNSLLDVCEDEQGNIWAAAESGLAKFDRGSGSYTHIPLDISESVSIDPSLFAVESYASEIWMGSSGEGVIRFEDAPRKFRRYLKGLTIMDLYKDNVGTLWAGTSVGLYRYDRDSDDFKSFSSDVRGVNCIIEDRQANLWLGGYHGSIYRVDKGRENVTVLDHRNMGVVVSSGFYAGGAFLESNGQIVLTSGDVTIAFDPEKVKYLSDTSRLYFTGFWIGERPVQALGLGRTQDSADVDDELRLSHKENTFSFTAADVDLRSDGSASITYMLENYDADWRSTQPEARIVYYKVPPGAYTLVIRNTNSSGQQGKRELRIVISPPWWATTSAYGIYAICFAGGVFGIHTIQKRRVIQAERERAKDRELAHAKEIEEAYQQLTATQSQLIQSEKMASLGVLTAGIAHEIQNPLNFVNNFSDINADLIDDLKRELVSGDRKSIDEIADTIKENEQKIIHHGKRADAIVKSMLQHSRSSSGQKQLTDINALCDEYLRLTYHGYRAKDKSFNTQLITNFDPSLPKVNIVRQDIGRVVMNLLNNAMYAVHQQSKQSTNGHQPSVNIATKYIKGKVEIRIRDNGNGISAAVMEKIFQPFFTTKPTGEGTGLGLSLAYDIIKGHSGEINVESKEGEGSEFIVRLPI